MPGLVNASTSTSQRVGLEARLLPQLARGRTRAGPPRAGPAARRAAPTARAPTAWRYCRTSSTRSSSSSATTPTAPGWRTRSRSTTSARRQLDGLGRHRELGAREPLPDAQHRRPLGDVDQVGHACAGSGAGSTPPAPRRPARRSGRAGSRPGARAPPRPARRTAGAAGSGASASSGCAWVPTKYGCTSRGSSTNSTSRPSGEVPEKTSAGRLDARRGRRCSPRSGGGAARTTSGSPYSSRDDRALARAPPGRARGASCRPGRARRRRRRPGRPSWRSPGAGVPGRTRRSWRRSRPASVRAVSITMHCRPRHRPSDRDAVLARVAHRAELALDAADAEAAGDAARRRRRPGAARRPPASAQSSDGTQRMFDLGVVGEPAGAQRLGDRQVGVGQVDVLADQRDRRPRASGGAPGAAGRPRRSSRRRGTAGRAGARRRRRGPRGAAPWGCRRWTARRRRRPRPPRRRRTSARSCA